MATATQLVATGTISSRFQPEYEGRPNSPYGLPIADDCASHTLRSHDLSCALSSESMRDLDRISHANSYPAGALLVVEGQTARGVYILCHGRAKLTTTNRDGKTLILKIAQPGDILGLDAVISGRPYEFNVETLHACQVAFVAREDFLRFLKNHGDACLYATQHLSRDCQAAYDSIRSMGLSHSVTEKLARLLLHWSVDAKGADGTIRIKLALTHEEIAQLIGSSRETITRILGEFRKRKLVELNGSTMLIRNKAALEGLASN
ncbi:MAG TPA: Crp/Fnr family transcriptional regulator [Terriglobales bacterium]|nr:Crp/Fnr family transcriptional regulator [Terriglobales bacterium]